MNTAERGTFTNFDSLDDKIDDLYYYMQFINLVLEGQQEMQEVSTKFPH